MKWKKYRTGDVLDFNSSNGIFHACNVSIEDNKTESNHPYVVRTSQNNGIRGYISEDESKLNPANTISFAQDTAQMFYQSEPYFTGNKVKVLSAKGHALTENIAIFLITCMNKAFSNFAWGSSYDTKLLQNVMLSLPVKTKYIPDFNLMSEIIGGIDMSNVDTSSWKEFKLGELFDIENTWNYGKNKQYTSQLKDKIGDSIAVVSGITTNNGINYYTEDILEDNEIYNDCLTISTRGEYSGSVFYHDYPFVLANNILTMPMPGLSKEAKLFMAAVIQALPFGGYGNYPTKDKLKESIIKLPVKETEEIDWEYMQERITELEQYLIATGLNDYELTDEDKKVLGMFRKKEFRLDELFSAESGDFDIKKEHINGLGIDVVTAGETENGILGKSDIMAKVFDGNTITIDMFGKCTYRPDCYKMVTHARVFSLKCLFSDFDEKSGLYMTTVLQKLVNGFSYSNMCSWNKIKGMSIKLPVKESEEIDWIYMKKYIRTIEKIVIKDVVKYKDEVIEKTKEIVNKNA